MLDKTRWCPEIETVERPSIVGFRQWLEDQDSEARFMYSDCNNCAVGQYLRSIGSSWQLSYENAVDSAMRQTLNNFARAAARKAKWTGSATFSGVLEVMERAGV